MIDLPMAPLVPGARMQGDEEQMAAGIGYCHTQIKKVANQTFVAAAEVAALARILQSKGLLTEEEFLSHREAEGKRLEKSTRTSVSASRSRNGRRIIAIDASTLPQVDCEARYHQCHGACCAMHFWLTVQDLEEGVVRWDLGRPYIIRQGSDGRCVHQDRGTLRCSVYEQRPGIAGCSPAARTSESGRTSRRGLSIRILLSATRRARFDLISRRRTRPGERSGWHDGSRSGGAIAMLTDLNNTIKQLLVKRIPLNPDEVEVSFECPKREWSSKILKPTINVYLFDLREDVERRETDWMVDRSQTGRTGRRRPPVYVSLSYFITTWAREVLDEHLLLWRCLTALMRELSMGEDLLQGSLKGMGRHIKTATAQADGVLRNPGEFWSALDNNLKPAVIYSATLPVELDVLIQTPLVLTKVVGSAISGWMARQTQFAVGGAVRSAIREERRRPDVCVRGACDLPEPGDQRAERRGRALRGARRAFWTAPGAGGEPRGRCVGMGDRGAGA